MPVRAGVLFLAKAKKILEAMRTICLFLCTSLAVVAQAQGFYDTDQIQTIEIWFAQDDWDAILDDYYSAGNGERLLAQVVINGEVFDSVGVRYKGKSSYQPGQAKNPFNIKLDYVRNQDYEGVETIKLSNGAKDPSWVREVLGYEIARRYMVAPRANYARVFVNGQYHGLYANVEAVDKAFVARHFFSDKDNTFFECTPPGTPGPPPFGCAQGEGAGLQYLGPGVACYADYYELISDAGWNDLLALITTLHESPEELESVLDLDRVLWMLAFHNVVVNLDSYIGLLRQNYYLFRDDHGRFNPVPWDLNETFGRFPQIEPGPPPPFQAFVELDPFLREGEAGWPLLQAIYDHPTWRRMYVAHMRTILSENFSNGWYLTRAAALQDLIGDAVAADANAFFTLAQMQQNLQQTVVWGGPDGRAPGLAELMEPRTDWLWAQPELAATPPQFGAWSATPAEPQAYSALTLTVEVTGAQAVWLGWRHQHDEPFARVPMYDDGQHGDGAAGDGVWGATIDVQVGQVQWYFYAENEEAGAFLPERAEHEWLSLGLTGEVVVNELMASNRTAVADAGGEYDDWIELHNRTAAVADLSGWYLTDDRSEPFKWMFPQGSFIEAGGYLIVWADDDEGQPGLHASFKLDADGEELWLVDPAGHVRDGVVFGPQPPDLTWGRYPNGTGAFAKLDPTFAASNSAPVGVREVSSRPQLLAWPNPFADVLRVSGPAKEVDWRLLDLMGRVVAQGRDVLPATLRLPPLPQGMYLLQAEGFRPVRLVKAGF